MLRSNLSARRGSAGDSRGDLKVAPLSLFLLSLGRTKAINLGGPGAEPQGSFILA